MTGLDQDMMQKNLTCKTLREAQKDMCTYGFAFVPANLLFMSLGVLLLMLAQQRGMALPESNDELLPMFAASGLLGQTVVVFFTIGIVAASFSSADSAMTSLTTSWCVDICGRADDEKLRRRAHIGVAMVFALFIILIRVFNSTYSPGGGRQGCSLYLHSLAADLFCIGQNNSISNRLPFRLRIADAQWTPHLHRIVVEPSPAKAGMMSCECL